MKRSSQGGLLMTVMIALAIVGMVAGSVASLINFQRKAGIGQQLKLHSMNAAEAAIDYAYAYITNDADLNGLDESIYIPPSGSSPKAFDFPPDALSFLQNKNPLPTSTAATDAINFTDIKVSVMPRPATATRIYKDPKTTSEDDPNRGQWVYQETITLVAAVTSTQGGIKQIAYARKDINYNITNLFQHSIFFQGQLHLHRGFKVMGATHTNGNLILNAHDGDHAIYNGYVTAGNRFYRGSITDSGGSGMDAFGLVQQKTNGDLDETKFTTGKTGLGTGETDNPLGNGDIPIYIDTPTTGSNAGKHMYRYVEKNMDSRMTSPAWKDTATSLFKGHLEDKSHNVPIINPIGSVGYSQDVASTTSVNEFKNGPYFLIEPLLPPGNPLRATKSNYRYNLSANASLVLRVEYAARTSTGALVPNPNTTLGYTPMVGDAAIANSKNPSNYIVRAYKKVAAKARANDPDSTADRVPIPFPTDVIGRADYSRYENTGGVVSAPAYNYAAGADSQPIDILGTERGITSDTAATIIAPAGLISPARAKSVDTSSAAAQSALNRRTEWESWHRYRIENYRIASAASYRSWSTSTTWTATTVLPGIGTPVSPWAAQTAITPVTSTTAFPLYGLHDARMGRGVHLLTLDISRLKEIMEADPATVATRFGAEAKAFRDAFNNGTHEWNGIVYVEFPTSTEVDVAAGVNPAPTTSAYAKNATRPWDPAWNDPAASNLGSYLDTYRFKYATTAEVRHPLRTSATDSRANREDNIVPIAQTFREYPSTVNSATITDPLNAIMALQVIHAKRLPKVSVTKFDGNASNTLSAGFTLATNAPLYLVGSWNSDGDYTTGAKVTSTNPNDYATPDTVAAGDSNFEIPSAIFCDSITVLSPGWATQTNYPGYPTTNTTRRQNSFNGWGSDSYTYRQVTWKNANERIEISACIATGEFPVFEFFTHALEDFNKTNGTPCTPLVVKGSMVGMFTSEIQHIKQAYGRNATKDIQVYWAAHGAHCFPSPRLHKFILDGNFPPGTPQALVPSQSNFQVIFKGDPMISAAGF